MTRQSKYFAEIERLLKIGYEPKHIMALTNIPKPTVYRIVDKLRKEARYDFNNLMEKDFLYKYQQNLENISLTIQQTNEEIEAMTKKYATFEYMLMKELEMTPETKHMARATLLANLISNQTQKTNTLERLIAKRDAATEIKARLFNQGPVIASLDEWVNSGKATNAPMPRLKMLDDAPKEVTVRQLRELKESPTELNNSSPDISQEDMDVLREMNEDENNED